MARAGADCCWAAAAMTNTNRSTQSRINFLAILDTTLPRPPSVLCQGLIRSKPSRRAYTCTPPRLPIKRSFRWELRLAPVSILLPFAVADPLHSSPVALRLLSMASTLSARPESFATCGALKMVPSGLMIPKRPASGTLVTRSDPDVVQMWSCCDHLGAR